MRRAEVRTELDDAEAVAAAVRPDDTEQMDTRVEAGAVVTTIERETTGGLRATVDDYVVNLGVAARIVDAATRTDDTVTRTDDVATGTAQHGETARHEDDTTRP